MSRSVPQAHLTPGSTSMNAPLNLEPQRTLVQGDGVRLATYQWGNAKGPVLLLVHGYPDNHRVWLPLVRELAADYRK